MKCENREEKISLYIDRQLDWQEEKEFLKHIKECPECKEALQQAQQIRQMLLDMPMEEVPQGLHDSIVKTIQKEIQLSPAKNTKRISWQKYGALAASFLLLIGGAYFYKTTLQQHSSTAETTEMATMQLEEATPNLAMNIPEEVVEEQYDTDESQLPMITQKRSVNAPETAKALPKTPSLGAGFTRDAKKKAEGEEQAEAEKVTEQGQETETTEQKQIEQTQSNDDEEKNGAENGAEQQSVLTQPVTEDEKTKNDKKEGENTEQTQEKEGDSEEVVTNVRRAVPTNMKSKSLQISLKAKQPEQTAKNIEKRAKSLKGEIEVPYEQSGMTIKIPVAQYNDVVNWLGQQCEVTDRNEIVEDLGKQYKEIQQQLDEAKAKEKQAKQKGQSRRAQEARKTQKECEKALEELQKTADFATIHITFIE